MYSGYCTDDDLFLSGLPMSVKQEMVNEDSVNRISDGGVHFPEQEMVNEDFVNHILNWEVDLSWQETIHEEVGSSDAPQYGGLRQG